MPDYEYLESALPGFTEARDIIKAAGDSVFPLQHKGSKFPFAVVPLSDTGAIS